MYLTDSRRVREFCRSLADAPYVAVDTEFLREKTYFPKLCLVQIGYRDDAAAIDPLADGIDMEPVYELLADERVLKVFHSASQDFEVLLREAGELPYPVFDTQIAAMVCGFGEQPGYATLVSELLDVRVDKASQFTDWSRRPLSSRQVDYALGDVIHLCPVYERMCEILDEKGRADWVDEEMDALLDEDSYRVEPRRAYKRIRIRRPTRRALGVLRELAAWREETAQRRDIPRNWVAKDEALATLALNPPTSAKGLAGTRGLGAGFSQRQPAEELFDAIRAGQRVPESKLPSLPERRPPPAPGHERLVALLQALLRHRADDIGVAPSLIANRADLDRLAADDDADIRAMNGWRYDHFGRHALDLKEGRIALTGDVDGVRLIDM